MCVNEAIGSVYICYPIDSEANLDLCGYAIIRYVVCLTYAKFLLNFVGPVAGLYSRIVVVDHGTYYLFASQARPAFKEILVTLSAITN